MGQLLEEDYGSGVRLLCYADDLALYVPRPNHLQKATTALQRLESQCNVLGLKLNPQKSCYMAFGLRPLSQPLTIHGTPLRHATSHKYLGVWFDSRLSFRPQITSLRDRLAARNKVLQYMSVRGQGASPTILRRIYIAAVRSVVDYCAPCLPGLPPSPSRHWSRCRTWQ